MNSTKPAIASVGVWGSIISIVAPFVGILIQAMGASTNVWIAGAAGIFGAIMSLYGRVTATQTISGVVVTPPASVG
jgi:hypothetical protein